MSDRDFGLRPPSFFLWSFNMKSYAFRVGSLLLGGLALISAGCQEDNEAAIKAQEAKSSDAQVKATGPAPKSLSDMADQYKASGKTAGYPGSKK